MDQWLEEDMESRQGFGFLDGRTQHLCKQGPVVYDVLGLTRMGFATWGRGGREREEAYTHPFGFLLIRIPIPS